MAELENDLDGLQQRAGKLSQQELIEIIAAYDQATTELQKTHESLRRQVEHLSGELSRKNQELSNSLEEVSALKNYLANILESITDGVIAIGPDRRVMAFNQSAAQVVLAMSTDQMGQPIADVLPAACKELGKILIKALEQKKGFVNIEVNLPGKERKVLSVSASPIRNERGEILGAVQTFRDLTAIKSLEERATRQERLAALGEMAAGVAHEIRNPLGGIELYASTLKRRFENESKEAGIAEKIIAAAGALNRIVTDMLTFTRGREPVKKPVVLERVCAAAIDMAARALENKNINVELRHALGKRRVMVDSDLITQCFLNVLLNAVQFTPEGGTIVIASYITADPTGDEAVVEFVDGGPGISQDAFSKLFNPFFTTRKDGTGLGLAIVHKIVQDHGALVIAKNAQDGGACFSFRFPVNIPSVETDADATAGQSADGE